MYSFDRIWTALYEGCVGIIGVSQCMYKNNNTPLWKNKHSIKFMMWHYGTNIETLTVRFNNKNGRFIKTTTKKQKHSRHVDGTSLCCEEGGKYKIRICCPMSRPREPPPLPPHRGQRRFTPHQARGRGWREGTVSGFLRSQHSKQGSSPLLLPPQPT